MELISIPYVTEYNYIKMTNHFKFFSKKYFEIIKKNKAKKYSVIRQRLEKIEHYFKLNKSIYYYINEILNNLYIDLENKTLNLNNISIDNKKLILLYNIINSGNLNLQGTNLFNEIIQNTFKFLNHLYNEKERILKWA